MLDATRLDNNQRFSTMLQELENCRFIRQYLPYSGKKRDITYQLIDPFLHFSLQVQAKCKYQDENYWSHSINSPIYNAWSCFAFEMLCLNHVPQIKAALKIEGVQTSVYCWRTPAQAERGAQIDLLIDRADHCINLCEMKFCRGKYTITKAEREKIENRMQSFIAYSKTKSSIRLTMITSFGVEKNVNSGIIQNELTLEDLF